jgi:hypothetical protein
MYQVSVGSQHPDCPQPQGKKTANAPISSFFSRLLVLLTTVATTAIPSNFALADDCLAAPNSPAPKGSHWYYHLNRATQQKCWYVRSSEKQPQQATAQTTSADAAMSSTRAGQAGTTEAHEIRGASHQVEKSTKALDDPASNTILNRSAQVAPRGNAERATSRESTSSDTNVETTAPTPVVWPDPPPMAPAISAREASAVAADAALDAVSDNAESAASTGERTAKFEIPIVVFPALAIGLVVVGFAGRRLIKMDPGARHAQMVDRNEADQSQRQSFNDRLADSSTREEHDFQSFVQAVSDPGPSENTVGPVQTGDEISTREARLAQLREEIDRRRRWPFPAQAQPQRQKVVS